MEQIQIKKDIRTRTALFMKKYWKIICIIIMLVIIDQGTKLVIERFYEHDTEEVMMQVKDTVHIHPKVNYITTDKLALYAEKTGMPVSFWQVAYIFYLFIMITVFVFFVWCCYKTTVLAGIKTHSRLVNSIIILLCAVGICGICDRLFWDGTHDFLCISKTYIADTGNLRILHLTRDIKDWYLSILTVLFIVYLILFVLNINKLSKNKEAYSELKKAIKVNLKKRFGISGKRREKN